MLRKSLVVHPKDSVAMVLENAAKGDVIKTPHGEITLLEDVEFAHKVAITDIEENKPVYKYGEEIGFAKTAIPKGAWVHGHNLGCDRGTQRRA
ncbi:MAG: UxaA family hydrolase [Negativicutes bacterium]|nr:UxaA family hydrolase [Negativicutes bacterium]